MAVLKRIKASTLMETMVATVLIVVIFGVCSMVLNNMLKARAMNDTTPLRERLHELEYLHMSQQLQLPHHEELGKWEITLIPMERNGQGPLAVRALLKDSDHIVTQYLYHAEE
ncbi:MAG: hypothetical protein AB3N16_10935 [Flavobacteriaceae bacterium]